MIAPKKNAIASNHVLFIAGDPGGAEALLPVVGAWPGVRTVLAYRQAATRFRSEGVTLSELGEAHSSTTEAEAWLMKIRPDCICAATSVNGVDWERYFFTAARSHDIPTLAVLDYWSNYAIRFTLREPLDAIPDVIAIMDDRARREMISEAFPRERLHITGQPVFDEAQKWHSQLPPDSRDRFRAELGLKKNEFVFMFVSQPLSEMRRQTKRDMELGNESDALRRVEKMVSSHCGQDKVLLIKMHPRESVEKFKETQLKGTFRVKTIDPSYHRWKACLAADRILGMNSMLLEEARVLGCSVEPILSETPRVPDAITMGQSDAVDRIIQLISDVIADRKLTLI